jgi:hypothetical protein
MTTFDLTFQQAKFPVPRGVLINFFERHPDIFHETSYEVRSSVPLEIFQEFIQGLESGKQMEVTKQNAGAVALLAQEFGCSSLLAVAAAQIPVIDGKMVQESIAELSERISNLEHKVLSGVCSVPTSGADSWIPRVSAIEQTLLQLQSELSNSISEICELKSQLNGIRSTIPSATGAVSAPSARPSPVLPASKSRPTFTFELPDPGSLDGIIAYLTQRCGGNVDDRHIVEFSPSSARVLADLNSRARVSQSGGISWDFLKKRVVPTHYTLLGFNGDDYPEGWMIEGSLDRESWVVLDQRADNHDLAGEFVAWSYAFANPTECRYIRMCMKGVNHANGGWLSLCAVEFFGTLLD